MADSARRAQSRCGIDTPDHLTNRLSGDTARAATTPIINTISKQLEEIAIRQIARRSCEASRRASVCKAGRPMMHRIYGRNPSWFDKEFPRLRFSARAVFTVDCPDTPGPLARRLIKDCGVGVAVGGKNSKQLR